MHDLNDLYYFSQVVEQGGFSAAGRHLGMPKSTISRRIADLEARLEVRLLQRSTRRITLTEIGEAFYQHCLAMVAEADAAFDMVEQRQTEPQGLLRVTCPVSLLNSQVSGLAAEYLALYPKIRLHLTATNRPVHLINEGVDIALRVRFPPLEDEGLVMRKLADSAQLIVAAPALMDGVPALTDPDDIATMPFIDLARDANRHGWKLKGPNGDVRTLGFTPRFICDDLGALARSARAGIGIAQLPDFIVADDLASGKLIRLLPDWDLPTGIVHAVFPSRRGLSPAVRSFVDFLAQRIG